MDKITIERETLGAGFGGWIRRASGKPIYVWCVKASQVQARPEHGCAYWRLQDPPRTAPLVIDLMTRPKLPPTAVWVAVAIPPHCPRPGQTKPGHSANCDRASNQDH